MRSDFSKKKKKVSDDVLRRAGIFTAVFLCCLLLFGGVAVYVVLRAGDERDDLSLPSVSTEVEAPAPINVLLCLTREEENYSDAMFFLFRWEFESGRIPVTALPAETVLTAGEREDTLAGHMTYGGIPQVKNALLTTLGAQADRYMILSLTDFAGFVDKLGGVDYTIPSRLFYKENETLVTALEPGFQHLNGTMMIQLLSYPEWSEGREKEIDVQQEVLTALFNQHSREDTLQELPALFRSLANQARTDLSAPLAEEILKAYQPFLDREEPARVRTLDGAFASSDGIVRFTPLGKLEDYA